ncbi:MAG: class I SAM-dependent RNA methyltransferase [Firmicutes bacterium]|nr:class I SAM-dependent RNA methyltransferase [Bacillota bacterium]
MQLKIEKMDHLGRGIGYINNKVVFVPKTLINDYVEIKITKNKKKYYEASLIKIIKPSEKRINSICPYFSKCGGCNYLNTFYENTLEIKKNKIKNIMNKINLNIEPIIIKNNNDLYYRNKISLKIKNKKIGFYENKSNNLIEINYCYIVEPIINKAIELIKKWDLNNAFITIRSNYLEEVLIIVETKENIIIDNLIIDDFIKGIIINDKCVYKDDYFIEKINDLKFKVSYNSFFQINRYINSLLFSLINDFINQKDVVLDLYCGVGSLSLNAALKAKKVVGIEIVKNAIKNALENNNLNNVKNANFILGDVQEKINDLNDCFDTVIIDPPRAGIDQNSKEVLLKLNPKKIIYVSCDPQTLARDLTFFQEKYSIKQFYILDMFSYTYHVESLVLLQKKD